MAMTGQSTLTRARSGEENEELYASSNAQIPPLHVIGPKPAPPPTDLLTLLLLSPVIQATRCIAISMVGLH